ncbi:aqualysin-1-like [Lytechinus variegatus]|uniref:aqualysin-1-like n=1 Tax=Lytechinus variegatus TaxID=7654 RepID=UPI001BB0E394|nr:aqualysin-1-like [Lytechinus variegatus]
MYASKGIWNTNGFQVGKLPGVEYIEENGVVRSQSAGSWGLDRIDAHSTLYGPVLDNNYSPFCIVHVYLVFLCVALSFIVTGAGVDVYVIDSGILDTHEDFGDRATQGFCASDLFDFLGGGNVDCYGHGTHCAGTVGSKTYGVAPGVNLIGVKVIGCFGSGSTAGAIEGVNWVIEQATRLKARRRPSIAAMPLATFYSRALNDAVDAMVEAGIETAVAAGNDQVDACDYSPGSSTKVITVGSTYDDTDVRMVTSNYGQCVNIFAPGAFTKSTWIGSSNKATETLSGTSMACAHVAGALALYLTEEELMHQSTANVVGDAGLGSPNRFLYVHKKR